MRVFSIQEDRAVLFDARYYDSKIARFLQEDTHRGDPSDPLSLNLYAYCHNEPIMYTDPSGNTEANLRDLANAAGFGISRDGKKAHVNVNGTDVAFDNSKDVNGHIVIDDSEFRKAINNVSSKTNTTVDSTSVDKNGVSATVVKARDSNGSISPTISTGSSVNNYKLSNHNSTSWLDSTTPPLKGLGIATIPSSGDMINNILSTVAGSITGTIMGNTDKVEKPLTAFENSNGFYEKAPAGSTEIYVPKVNKNIALVGDIASKGLAGLTLEVDLANTWTADSGNTNKQRLEKSGIQVVSAGVSIDPKVID